MSEIVYHRKTMSRKTNLIAYLIEFNLNMRIKDSNWFSCDKNCID